MRTRVSKCILCVNLYLFKWGNLNGADGKSIRGSICRRCLVRSSLSLRHSSLVYIKFLPNEKQLRINVELHRGKMRPTYNLTTQTELKAGASLYSRYRPYSVILYIILTSYFSNFCHAFIIWRWSESGLYSWIFAELSLM